MKRYDYLHDGLADGLSAIPGRVYTIVRTQQKIKADDAQGWRATRQVTEFEEGNARLFVRDDGAVAYFSTMETLK